MFFLTRAFRGIQAMSLLQVRKAAKSMDKAENYEQWQEAAQAHDKASGKDRWRVRDQSSQYDNVSIRIRLDRLRSLRARHDYRGLLFTLYEGIHGNMGGMGKSSLYAPAMFGTKQLIVDYVEEIVDALELLAGATVDEISFEEKLEFFRRAHHCFGQSALLMSGSGTLLYFHIGVVKALWEQDMLPKILSGSSGGSIVGSLLCTHNDKELKNIFNPAFLLDEVEQESAQFASSGRFGPGVLQAGEVEEMIQRLIPDMTFQESFEHSGRVLNISVAPAETHQTSRLLNAATSPNVLIRKSVMASAAVPGVFPPVTLEARDKWGERQPYLPSRKWVDGSVSDDLPTKRLARLYGVNHYVVSQANPAVLPFVTDGNRRRGAFAIIQDASRRTAREWMNAGAAIMHKPLSKETTLARVVNTALSMVNQDYVGDINILPRSRLYNPLRLLARLNADEIMKLVTSGERSAWQRIEMIRIQTRISRTLDRIMTDYEAEALRKLYKTNGRRKAA
jgi:TAG lipase/steryl ester hydrolase/phospholipase A2/LPA acyltransferase